MLWGKLQAVDGHLRIRSAEEQSSEEGGAPASALTGSQEQFHIPSLLKQRVVEVGILVLMHKSFLHI